VSSFGLSGAGWMGIALETVKGTFVPATVFVPIISESFKYTEARYLSPQIRQQVVFSDVKQGYYHIEGDIECEVDAATLPYFLFCSRHTPTSAAGIYTFVPSSAGSTSTAASGMVQRTMSVTIVRNGQGFGYAGCAFSTIGFSIEEGILRFKGTLMGESDAGDISGTLPTPTWAASNLFGADASAVYVDTSGTAPTFATPSTGFDGFTFEANHNASAENRIVRARSASYIAFHQTEVTLNTTLDFADKTEYNLFVAGTQKAFRLESINGGANWAASTSGVRVDINRGVYETYDLGLSGLGDIIKAGVTAQGIGITGGSPYKIWVKSSATIT
jgi:hypothetical protein